jgi:hypothetical protein
MLDLDLFSRCRRLTLTLLPRRSTPKRLSDEEEFLAWGTEESSTLSFPFSTLGTE